MSEIHGTVQLVEEFKEEEDRECLKKICYPSNLNFPVTFDKYDYVTSFLDCEKPQRKHWAHECIAKGNGLFLKKMVWKSTAVEVLNHSDKLYTRRNMWRMGNELPDTGVGESNFTRKRDRLNPAKYSTQINFVCPLDDCSYKKEYAKPHQELLWMKLLHFFMIFAMGYAGGEELSKKHNRIGRSSSFNLAVPHLHAPLRDRELKGTL